MRPTHWVYTIPLRLRSLFRRGPVERDLDDELRFHLENQIDQYIARGLTPADARRAALRAFGGVEQRKEDCRDMRHVRLVDELVQDIRYAIRGFAHAPAFTAVVLLTLALGIGANTAIFSLVDTLLLKRLPVADPEQLFNVERTIRGSPSVFGSYKDYVAFRDQSRAFTGLAAVTDPRTLALQAANEGTAGVAELAYASFVSGNYFDVLGVDAAIGRLFNAQQDRQFGASPYTILSYEYWQRRFAGDPGVIGRTIRLNGYPLTIIGVSRWGFGGVDVTTSPNVFVPITMYTEVFGVPRGMWNTRRYFFLQAVGRLAPGVTPAQASAQLSAIFKAQEEAAGRPPAARAGAGQTIWLLSAARGYSSVRDTLEKPLLLLAVVVGVVLLIACANVASLMLARGAARQREMAVRLAIGAGRSRLAGQLLVESLLLSLAGGMAGLVFAYGCVRLVLGFVPQYGQQLALTVSPDVRLLAFTSVISVVTGLVFGLAPALQSTRPDLVTALKVETAAPTRGRITLRRLLVVGQVALSLLLLVGAGLLVRTLQNLGAVDLGLRPERTLVADIDPTGLGYKGQRLREFYERLRANVARAPGVRSVTLASITPLSGGRWSEDVSAEGYTPPSGDQMGVDLNAVAPRYFETLGVRLVLGRDFQDTDNPATTPDPPERLGPPGETPEAPGPRVAIITEGLAKRFFAGRNPIGLHVCFQQEYDPSKAYEIVGVVRDVHYASVREAATEMVYVPSWRRGLIAAKALVLRADQNASDLTEMIRRKVAAIDPGVPVRRIRTMQQVIDRHVAVERLVTTVSTLFSGLALLLASVGLYGVMAFTVSRRTREIGIRMALGADRCAVLCLVLRGAAGLVIAGAAIGLPAALVGTRALRAYLFGVTAQDPGTVLSGIVILVVVAAVAALVPARRAAAVQPTTALRWE